MTNSEIFLFMLTHKEETGDCISNMINKLNEGITLCKKMYSRATEKGDIDDAHDVS